MRVESAGTPMRWVLLCALALGMLGMHHLTGLTHGDPVEGHTAVASALRGDTAPRDIGPAAVAAPERYYYSGPTVTAPSTSGHGTEHHLLAHLCLAVLAATGVGLLLILLPRTPRGPAISAHVTVTGDGSPPPPLTSTRLASLCVLRL